MATIIIDNTTSEQVARYFIYQLDLNNNNNRIDPEQSLAYFVKSPLETATIFRQLQESLKTPEGRGEVTSFSDTKATIQTSLLSDDDSDVNLKLVLNGRGFETEDKAFVQNANLTYNFINYFDSNKNPNNIDVSAIGSGTTKIAFKFDDINKADDVNGNMAWSSDVNTDKGYYHNDDKQKSDYSQSTTLVGDLTITTNNELTGIIKNFKKVYSENKGENFYSSNINLISTAGLFANEKQEYAGTVNSLSHVNMVKSSSPEGYRGGTSYKETLANNQLASTLAQFIADQADIFDLTAALFNQNDKITAKGAFTTINGYAGNDAINLGSGSDTVEFSTSLGTNNIDTIKGFKKAGNDKLKLSSAIFEGYSGGDNFVIGTVAADANDRIIYDNKSGKLFYDADGTGSVAAVQFATLVGKPSLSAADIYTF